MEQVPGSRAVSQNDGITVPVNHNMRTVTSLEILTPYQVPTCGLQNGIRVNDRAISDENYVFDESDIVDGQIKIAQGKKKFGLIKQAG